MGERARFRKSGQDQLKAATRVRAISVCYQADRQCYQQSQSVMEQQKVPRDALVFYWTWQSQATTPRESPGTRHSIGVRDTAWTIAIGSDAIAGSGVAGDRNNNTFLIEHLAGKKGNHYVGYTGGVTVVMFVVVSLLYRCHA